MKTIYLAAGCFWGSQAFYSQMKGVLSTRVGYADWDKANPSYEDLRQHRASHAETVKIDYDENILSLEKILSYYLEIINPYSVNHQGEDLGLQYRTGIFYVAEEDHRFILNFLKKKEAEYNKGRFAILVEPLSNFYDAEEYHQDYLKKNPHGYCHVNLNLVKKEDRK